MTSGAYNWWTKRTITDAVGTTPEIVIGSADEVHVYIPSGSSITTLTLHGSPLRSDDAAIDEDEDQTFYALHDSSGAVTVTVSAGRCYKLPSDVVGLPALKIVGNAGGEIYISGKH